MPDRNAAKQLILRIIAVAGTRLEGKTRLHKAFYAAHLFYWREQQGVLTDYPVVKLPNGPGVDGLDGLIEELEHEGAIGIAEEPKGPYIQTVISLKVPVPVDPTQPDYSAILKAVRWVKSRTTPELERITHGRPSYNAQDRIGYEQAIYLDAVSEDEYERIRVACQQADTAFRTALGA